MCTKFNAVKKLVSGLSKSEKRYFHVFSTRHIIDSKLSYFELYELVRKEEIDTIEKLIPHYPQLKKQSLEIALSRLYDQLLASLTLFHTQSDPYLLLNQQISHIHLLIKRNLLLEAEHELNKILLHIERYNHWEYLDMLESLVEHNISSHATIRSKLLQLKDIQRVSIKENRCGSESTSPLVKNITLQLETLATFTVDTVNSRLQIINDIRHQLDTTPHNSSIKQELMALTMMTKNQVLLQDHTLASSVGKSIDSIDASKLSEHNRSRFERMQATNALYINAYANCRKIILQINPANCSTLEKLVDEFIVVIALLLDKGMDDDFIRQRLVRLNRLIKKSDQTEVGLYFSNFLKDCIKNKSLEELETDLLKLNKYAEHANPLYYWLHSYIDIPYIFTRIIETRSTQHKLKLVG